MDLVDHMGVPLLHAAVRSGTLSTVKLLLERGADVNEKCQFGPRYGSAHFAGMNPLHLAVRLTTKEAAEIAKLLIERGIAVNATTLRKRTPLDLARRRTMQELLKSNGAKSGKDLPRETGDDETF